MDSNTITAVATPPGTAGVAILRLSGTDAFRIAETLFTPVHPAAPVRDMAGYTAAYGTIHAGGIRGDAVLLVFRAPRSYTGEDVCEIQCHGGSVVITKLLHAAIAAGAQPAAAGEFTKRAFLNGKVSLSQAEAIHAVITAQSESAVHAADFQKSGKMKQIIDGVCDKLLNVSATLTALLDYPEETTEAGENIIPAHISEDIETSLETLTQLRDGFHTGALLRDGIRTVFLGSPNVGKSSLFNKLAGRERSIVTDIAGTTRDIVEECIVLPACDGVPPLTLIVSDCAGVRNTGDRTAADVIESIGVSRTIEAAADCDVIIAIFDGSRAVSEDDIIVLNIIHKSTTPVLCVVNKSDLPAVFDEAVLENKNVLRLSAKNMPQVDVCAAFANAVSGVLGIKTSANGAGTLGSGMLSNGMLSNAYCGNLRQLDCVTRACESLSAAANALCAGLPDAAAYAAADSLQCLYELEGKGASDTIVSEVFARFCVGK